MAVLTRADLTLQPAEVEVDGGTVFVRRLGAMERMAYLGAIRSAFDPAQDEVAKSLANYIVGCELVARTLCDSAGVLMFESADAVGASLADGMLWAIVTAAANANALGADAKKD